MKWKDKRDVFMLTIDPIHDTAELLVSGARNRNGVEKRKPQCILYYNTAKKGVDYSDQMCAYYSPLRKTRKWYRKAAFELMLGTSMVNAYSLYNKYHNRGKMSIKKFRESIILSLLRGHREEYIHRVRESSIVGGTSSTHFFDRNGW